MDPNSNTKQQIIEKLRNSNNILVAVSNSPSVDSLAAALGLTLILNKLDKHPTAIFSGQIPPALEFLEPGKTFDSSVDGLRDFIISLDKEKADRLRYKVEEDLVRIFITPYKTTIGQDDLHFSEGDFNVDLIVALGVAEREDLDKVISSHGRILHDATVITINTNKKSTLGAIDWIDPNASSLCEMVMSMADNLKQGLLDTQISNSLLTGIVAATERFSNRLTTPRVMTAAAQLMAAGANQQLISDNLQKVRDVSIAPLDAKQDKSSGKEPGDELSISHKKEEEPASEATKDEGTEKKEDKFDFKKQETPKYEPPVKVTPPPTPSQPPSIPAMEDLKQAVKETEQITPIIPDKPKHKEEIVLHQPGWRDRDIEPPELGGALNATSEEELKSQAAIEAEKRNMTILSHESKGEKREKPMVKLEEQIASEVDQLKNAPLKPEPRQEPKPEPKSEPKPNLSNMELMKDEKVIAPASSTTPPPPPTLTPIAQESIPKVSPPPEPPKVELPKPAPVITPESAKPAAQPDAPKPEATLGALDVESARKAVQDALSAQPFDSAHHPSTSIGSQQLGSPFPQTPQTTAGPPEPAPGVNSLDLPPPPPLPPMPANLTDMPPPVAPTPVVPPVVPVVAPPPAPVQTPKPVEPSDPSQFKIPT